MLTYIYIETAKTGATDGLRPLTAYILALVDYAIIHFVVMQ